MLIFLVLAVGLLMSSLENIGTIDFQRDLLFGKQVQIMMVPRLASMIATVGVALVWHTYWALVVGILINRGMRVIYTYMLLCCIPIGRASHSARGAGW